MAHYYYKREALRDWMARDGVSAYELKEILGLRSTNNIEVWMGKREAVGRRSGRRACDGKAADGSDGSGGDGAGWMPLHHILRLCNARGLPLSMFIGDDGNGSPASAMDEGVRAIESHEQRTKDNPYDLRRLTREIKDLQRRMDAAGL